MMRAGGFRHYAAKSAADAAAALAGERGSMLVGGGTDVIPNLKRRQIATELLVSVRRAGDMAGIAANGEVSIGAATRLSEIVRNPVIASSHRALFRAAAQVATPLIRNSATLGGNLCVDTRCNYYDQTLEWRRAIEFCKKAPGPHGIACEPCGASEAATCWVAPSSARCWAVSSSDTAPALIAHGARVVLRSADGEREIPIEALYADDGMEYLTKRRDEVLTRVLVPSQPGSASTYWKLRRRGSIDFPVLGVAASLRITRGVVESARIVLGAVASRPLLLAESEMLVGSALTDEVIEAFATRAAAHAKPLDNTDFQMTWRKEVARTFLAGVLRELRGDDPAAFPLLMREAAREPSPTW